MRCRLCSATCCYSAASKQCVTASTSPTQGKHSNSAGRYAQSPRRLPQQQRAASDIFSHKKQRSSCCCKCASNICLKLRTASAAVRSFSHPTVTPEATRHTHTVAIQALFSNVLLQRCLRAVRNFRHPPTRRNHSNYVGSYAQSPRRLLHQKRAASAISNKTTTLALRLQLRIRILPEATRCKRSSS